MKELLHEHGLKSTPLRIALLSVLSKVHHPLTADEIAAGIRGVEYDRATLYRSLKEFTRTKIITVIDLGEGCLRYEKICDVHHHHHHIICSACKKIEVVPVCIPDAVLKHLRNRGYKEVTHRIDFSGICKACA